jgi:hypothetical protein
MLDDTNGVEEISPGLPDSERATQGPNPLNPQHSRAKRGERSEYLVSPE